MPRDEPAVLPLHRQGNWTEPGRECGACGNSEHNRCPIGDPPLVVVEKSPPLLVEFVPAQAAFPSWTDHGLAAFLEVDGVEEHPQRHVA
jgi:hypothetical protein